MLDNVVEAYEGYRQEVYNVLNENLGDLENYLGDDGSPGSFAYYLNEAE
jgi:hypothetical protein